MEIIDTNILPSIITGFILKETKSNYQPSAPNKQEKRILMAPPCRLIPRFPRQVVEAQTGPRNLHMKARVVKREKEEENERELLRKERVPVTDKDSRWNDMKPKRRL